VADTPAALEAICLKALSKSPAARYDSAKALAADVERWLADEKVLAWKEPIRVRTGRWVRRHRTGVATTLAVLSVTVLGLLAVAVVQAESRRRLADKNNELEQANARVVAARDRAERRVDLALGAVDSFRSAVDDNLDVKNLPENTALRKTLLKAPLAFYERLRDDLRDSEDSGPEASIKLSDAYVKLADLNGEIGSLADALQAADAAVALLEPMTDANAKSPQQSTKQKLALALLKRGGLQNDSKGLSDAAMDSYARSRELLEAQVKDRPDDLEPRLALGRLLTGIAAAHSRKGNADAALTALRAGQSALEEARRRSVGNREVELLLARTHQQTGAVYADNKGQFPLALEEQRRAVAIAEPLVQRFPDDLACLEQLSISYSNLGRAYENAGDFAKALEIYGNRLNIAEQMVRARPSVSRLEQRRIFALDDIAYVHYALGQLEVALATNQKALDAAKTLVRDNPTRNEYKKTLATQWSRRAACEHLRGRLVEGLVAFEAEGLICEELSRADPGDVGQLRHLAGNYFNRGLLNNQLGRIDEALTVFRQSLALRERLAREHPDEPRFALDVGKSLNDIGLLLRNRKQPAEGLEMLRRSVEVLEKLSATDPANTQYRNTLGRSTQNVGLPLADMGQTDKGLKAMRKGLALFEETAREQPKVIEYRNDEASGHTELADMLEKAGQAPEAAVEFQRAIAVREEILKFGPAHAENRYKLSDLLRGTGASLQQTGKLAEAVRSYRRAAEVLEGATELSPERLCELACCYARIAGVPAMEASGLSDKEINAAADKALATLRRAVTAGLSDAQSFQKEVDFDSLRKRLEFQKLLAELEAKKNKSK
jgi:tetratricopeptide (TPR) repeat protein